MKENHVNFDSLKGVLGNADRLKELFAKREELQTELGEVDDEIQELSGVGIEHGRAPQKCSLCQKEGHSKRTCPTKGAS